MQKREKLRNAFEKLYIKLREAPLCVAASAELSATHKMLAALL